MPPEEISFRFEDNKGNGKYKAAKGMIWMEFIESEYNTLEFRDGSLSGEFKGQLYQGTLPIYILEEGADIVKTTDVVKNGGYYTIF